MPNDQATSRHTIPLILILIGVTLSGIYYYLYNTYPSLFAQTKTYVVNQFNTLTKRTTNSEVLATPRPTRSPYPLIPDQGTAGTFKVSHMTSGPKITDIIINPLDAKVGDKITLTLTLTHPTPVTSVTATIKTDKDPLIKNLSNESRSGNTEVWTANFKLNEPFLYTYIYDLVAKSSESESSLSVALRN